MAGAVNVVEVYVRRDAKPPDVLAPSKPPWEALAEAQERAKAAGGPPRPVPRTEGRRVRVSSLMIGYSHIHAAELILAGMPPGQAFDRCCMLFFFAFVPHWTVATGQWTRQAWSEMAWPVSGGKDLPHYMLASEKRPVARCFTQAAADNRQMLLQGEPEGGKFSTLADPALADQLAWMLEMMRRFGSGGGSLPQSARGALDEAAGRPRRRRRPVSEEWLAAKIDGALASTWDAIASTVTTLPTRRITFRPEEVIDDAR